MPVPVNISKSVATVFAVAMLSVPLAGAVAAPAAGPSLTVYTRDLGLVRERRTLELSGARDTVRIADLPERLDFSSLRLVPAAACA